MSNPPAGPRMVPGLTVNVVLAAAQTVAGTQYRHLLTAAGLERWLDSPPPPTMDPVATEAELSHLFATVYAILGESGTRLMMRNWGTTLAPMITAIPMVQDIVAEVAALPPADRLPQAMIRLQQITSTFWSPATLSEDASAWSISLTDCPVCAAIHGATTPLCTNLVAIYPRLLHAMTGQRLAVEETMCRAVGAATCTYAIAKPPVH